MAKKTGLVLVAALALAAPGAASATPGQDTGKDASCGVGPNGKAPNSQSGGDHLTPPFGSPQSFGCDSSTKARAADRLRGAGGHHQARPVQRGRRSALPADAGQRQLGGNSAGDTITGRFFLEKRGRRVGVVRYKGTIVALKVGGLAARRVHGHDPPAGQRARRAFVRGLRAHGGLQPAGQGGRR